MTGPAWQHIPVLLHEATDAVVTVPEGCYVDGTFGRGGHSRALLARLTPQGRVVAFDKDPQAVAAAAAIADARFTCVHASFASMRERLGAMGISDVHGVLLDLGVSSPQIDDPARGFSFRFDAPLDMRMDTSRGETAAAFLERADERQIAEVIRDYGEERFAVPIAKAIAARRRDAGDDAFRTTGQLAAVVAGVVRSRQKRPEVGKDPATRTFQALRILVNQELEELALVLDRAVARLKPGGRLVVLAFHSLEDRMVKEFLARESGRRARRDPVTGAPVHDAPPRLRVVARVLPDDAETAANPRARSAVLRIAERT